MAQIVTKDGRRVEAGRKYQIKELRDRHFEIIRRALLGEKYVEIAEALAITPKNVSDVVNSDLGQEQMQVLTVARDAGTIDITQDIAEVAPESLALLRSVVQRTVKLIKDDPAYIPTGHAIKVAQDNLDRAGYGAVKKQEVRKTSLHFNASEIERINEVARLDAERAIKVGKESGIVPTSSTKTEDAKFEVVEEEVKIPA